jgi:hypothetical protein
VNIGGTLARGVVRIAVVAATLALVYFFILRPVLDTTETVSGGISGNIQKAFDDVNEAFDQANGQNAGLNERRLKRRINATSGGQQARLLDCIQNARQDVDRMQRCVNRFAP